MSAVQSYNDIAITSLVERMKTEDCNVCDYMGKQDEGPLTVCCLMKGRHLECWTIK